MSTTMFKYMLAVVLAVGMALAQAAEEPQAKDKLFAVHGILESVDAEGAMITAKWVTGNDMDSVLWLFASRGDLLDPKVFPPRNSVQRSPEHNPRLVNVPVQPSAKIVSGKEALPLKDLKAGSVVSLQLAADPMKGLVIVGIGVVEKPGPKPAAADPKESRQKPAKDEKLLALIDQILTAHGGEEKLSKLQFTMTVKVDNGTTDKYFVQPPQHFRWESVHRDSKATQICILLPQGRQFWMQEPGGAAKPIFFFGLEPTMPYHLDRLKFFGPREVLRLKDADHQVARLEEIKIEGRPAVGLQVTYAGPEKLKLSHKLYFDQETHLLANLGETYYSDYKTFDGIPVARKEKHPLAGTGPWEAEVTDFRVVDKFDARLFKEP